MQSNECLFLLSETMLPVVGMTETIAVRYYLHSSQQHIASFLVPSTIGAYQQHHMCQATTPYVPGNNTTVKDGLRDSL
ncbi:hypothetical protein [Prevotella fusca]